MAYKLLECRGNYVVELLWLYHGDMCRQTSSGGYDDTYKQTSSVNNSHQFQGRSSYHICEMTLSSLYLLSKKLPTVK